MKAPLILPLLCLGCVVRYGTPKIPVEQVAGTGSDFVLADVDARIGLLLDERPESEQAARLEAARTLIRQASTWGPAERDALAAYLRVVVEAEELVLSSMPGPILAPLDPVVEERPDAGATPAAGGVQEEELGVPGGSLDAVSEGSACDARLRSERERAGRLFLEARALQDPVARRRGLEDARDLLASLLATCPDSPNAAAIRRNLGLVEREIEKDP